MSNTPIVIVDKVSKKYSKSLSSALWYGVNDILGELLVRRSEQKEVSLRKDEFWSLNNISFELNRGESLALIGDNGAGKSTLLKLIYGLIRPDTGKIVLRGNVGAMIELGAGFDQILSGRENIYNKAALFGYSRNKVDSIFDEIVDFAELKDFIDTPVQFYSSGMASRLAFAVTAHLKPDILLVDEVLAVGDIDFQRKCINHMLNYISSGGSLILVSHSPNHILSVCKRGILIDYGEKKFEGKSVEALNLYYNRVNKLDNYEIGSDKTDRNQQRQIVIEKVIFESLENEEIITGKACQVVVKYQCFKKIHDVIWGISIFGAENGLNITGNYNMNPQTINEGFGDLRCVIPKMPLLAGDYLLKVAIAERSSLQPIVTLGWENAPNQFKVFTEPNVINNMLLSTNQIILLDIDWA